jgi:hypothetical protein
MQLAIQFALQSQVHFPGNPDFLTVQSLFTPNQQAYQGFVGHS